MADRGALGAHGPASPVNDSASGGSSLTNQLRSLAGFGLSVLALAVACHRAPPAGTAPEACRHPAVVYHNASPRTVEILTEAQPYKPGSGEVLAVLAPGDSSAPIPKWRASGAFARDEATHSRTGLVAAEERCLDAPGPRPGEPSSPE